MALEANCFRKSLQKENCGQAFCALITRLHNPFTEVSCLLWVFDSLLEPRLQELVSVTLSGTYSFLITRKVVTSLRIELHLSHVSPTSHGELPCFTTNILILKYDCFKKNEKTLAYSLIFTHSPNWFILRRQVFLVI